MSSIRTRLLLLLACGWIACAIAGGWELDRRVARALVARFDAELLSRAWAMSNALASDDGVIELEGTHGIEAALVPSSNPVYYEVWKEDGAVAGRSPSLGTADLPRLVPNETTPLHADVDPLPNGKRGRAVAILVPLHAEIEGPGREHEPTLDRPTEGGALATVGTLTIVMAQDLGGVEATRASLRGIGIGIAIASLLFVLVFTAWTLRLGLAPLARLADQAHALDHASLERGFDAAGAPKELAPIYARLNELARRLRAAFAREQRFSAALAHELRTPIAELRGVAEVALARPGSERVALESILGAVGNMQALVEMLLVLRRAEAGQPLPAAEDFDLGVLAEDAIDDLDSAARSRSIEIALVVEPNASVRARRALVRRILDNLLRNAVEHAPPESTVDVRVARARDGDRVELRVSNLAPSTTESDVLHFFEPYWRKHDDANGAHVGLGLALCREFSAYAGVELDARLAEADVLELRVSVAASAGAPDRAGSPRRDPATA